MGILHHMPKPNTYCWVMGDQKTNNMTPTKVLFHRLGVFSKHPEPKNIGSYQDTMIFENDIKIHIYDSGMKTGHRVTLNYFVAKTFKDLFIVLDRILKLKDKHSEKYDYDHIEKYIQEIIRTQPELLI